MCSQDPRLPSWPCHERAAITLLFNIHVTGIEVDNDVVRADLSDVIRGIRPRIAEIRLVTVNWFDAKLNSFSFGVR